MKKLAKKPVKKISKKVKSKEKIPAIKVKLTPNADITSAKLQLDDNGELLTKVIKDNKYQYYQFLFDRDQVGISKNGKYWNVIPSKSTSDEQFNWFANKFTWCVKHGGYNNNTGTQVEELINKYIKFTQLNVFK